MSKRNLVLKNYLLTFIILFTFIFPTLSDYFVNLDRVALWEPDDAEHYILKKTQLQNCLIKVCKFNSSADFYVKEGLFDNSIILNADSGTNLEAANSGFFVKPLQNRIGQFAPGNNADVGKKFSFTVSQTSPTYSRSKAKC